MERDKFMEVVEIVRRRFPALRTELATEHPHVEALLEIPAQRGLSFPVSINLQNRDELHLNASSFWYAWFPCRKQEVCDHFVEAVCGLLSGIYRVVEYRRRDIALKAHLERRVGSSWECVKWWSRPHIPISWGMSTKIYQNEPCA